MCNKNGRVLKESEILFCHKDTCPVFTNPQVINKEVETYSVLVTYHDQWISIRVSEFSSELSSKHKKRKYHAWNLNIFNIGQTIHIVQRPENNWLRNHLCWGLILFMMRKMRKMKWSDREKQILKRHRLNEYRREAEIQSVLYIMIITGTTTAAFVAGVTGSFHYRVTSF